jgi:outer membrane receptor for ferrienterochelin and colicins
LPIESQTIFPDSPGFAVSVVPAPGAGYPEQASLILTTHMIKIITLSFFTFFIFNSSMAQLSGQVTHQGQPFAGASLVAGAAGTVSDSNGSYRFKTLAAGRYRLRVSAVGMEAVSKSFLLKPGQPLTLSFELNAQPASGDEAVVTGTLRPVHRLESPVPVEVISAKLFRKNASVCLFDAMGMVNGVQPQLNCNVCNTGDIHINGMEGPYTMVLIDGMPIVSSLSTVYGLSGIPNSMVERVEVVKGPAAALYGSEAMGGIINVITKDVQKAPRFAADIMGSSWNEYNADISVKWAGKQMQSLLGVNYYNYQQPTDKNKDGFTDITLQHRISVFNKWALLRKENRLATLAARYVAEDRWGGQMQWNRQWRGSDSVYGEQIDTRRWEMTGHYQLPLKEKIIFQWSLNGHYQDSYYGTLPFKASQQVFFVQAYWDKALGQKHQLLSGLSFRHTRYDDNTPATANATGTQNQPATTPLPGLFLQDEWALGSRHKLLAGYRFDYDRIHGAVHSPRIAFKWSLPPNQTLRASFGTGYRVVNLFTEDHAALTGAREVVITEALRPERSVNANINYMLKKVMGTTHANMDVTVFYTRFSNQVTADFDTDPNKIIYDNLDGFAVSKGLSLNTGFTFGFPLNLMNGISYMNVFQQEKNTAGHQQKTRQLFAPQWSGTFTLSYTLLRKTAFDVTGRWSGPMRLPVLPNDFRPAYSPWFATVNLQATHKFSRRLEVYGGVKNLFNFIPSNPIMRPFDPFDKYVNDPVNNPHGYTFDPSYNYASLQGIRFFAGLRVQTGAQPAAKK